MSDVSEVSGAPEPRQRNASQSALIIQDMQNDVIGEDGAFAETGAPAHARSQNVIANVGRLADAARARGMAVIHIHYVVEPGAVGLRTNAPLFQGVKDTGALIRGSWGASPVPGLEPRDGDFVIEKLRMNGFYDTRLDALLRGLNIVTLVIAGCYTNMSIEHTARHGADAGYEIVVVSDGTSTTSPEWQDAALHYAMTNVGRVAAVDEVISELGS